MIGKHFGRLEVLERIGTYKFPSGHTNPIWRCKCSCGNIINVLSKSLRSGSTTSCGCAQRDAVTKHGGSYDRLYNIWSGAKSRCYDKGNKDYMLYGGRGITMCEEWLDDYQVFKTWAYSNGYSEDAKFGDCTLDRINPDDGYNPNNCRFVPFKVQENNRRNNKIFVINGERKTVAQLAKENNIKYETLQSRLRKGTDIQTAISTPVRKVNPNEH